MNFQHVVYAHVSLLKNNKLLREVISSHYQFDLKPSQTLGYYQTPVLTEEVAKDVATLLVVAAQEAKLDLPNRSAVYTRDLVAEAIEQNLDGWALTTAPDVADYEYMTNLQEVVVEFPGGDKKVRLVYTGDRKRLEQYQILRYRSFIGFSRQITRELAAKILAGQKSVTLDELGIH